MQHLIRCVYCKNILKNTFYIPKRAAIMCYACCKMYCLLFDTNLEEIVELLQMVNLLDAE